MTDDDPVLIELHELLAFLSKHAGEIPAHRRRHAVVVLERVERLVPLREADAVDVDP